MSVVGEAATIDEALDLMEGVVESAGTELTVAVGLADPASAAATEEFADRLDASGVVEAMLRYRVGPSVGAHTGPGTLGGFFFAAE